MVVEWYKTLRLCRSITRKITHFTFPQRRMSKGQHSANSSSSANQIFHKRWYNQDERLLRKIKVNSVTYNANQVQSSKVTYQKPKLQKTSSAHTHTHTHKNEQIPSVLSLIRIPPHNRMTRLLRPLETTKRLCMQALRLRTKHGFMEFGGMCRRFGFRHWDVFFVCVWEDCDMN